MTHCQDPTGLPPLLAHQLKHYASMDARAAKGLCLHTCQELRKWFPAVTLVCGAVEWSGEPMVHWWLEYDGRVIDPTRQQFGASPVTFWRAKAQSDRVDGFWREVGDYAKAHPEASQREVLSALCDAEPAYQDDGTRPSDGYWFHACREFRHECGMWASVAVYLSAGESCVVCGAVENHLARRLDAADASL